MCFLPGMGEARRFNYRGGPLGGGGSVGECSGLPVDTVLNQRQVVGFHFDADRVETFDECGLDGGARSRERVKHGATGWGDETDQPSHDREGLHGRVLHPVHVRTLRLRSLRHIEESGCAATTSITQVLTPRRKGGAIHSRLHSAMPDRYPVLLHPALFVYPCGGVVVE